MYLAKNRYDLVAGNVCKGVYTVFSCIKLFRRDLNMSAVCPTYYFEHLFLRFQERGGENLVPIAVLEICDLICLLNFK